jgi:ditrans,polycis-polyprenyl diphosphate synthase
VTIYAFSIENFKRSRYEVDALMSLAKLKLTQLAQHGELLSRYGASIRVLGQRSLVKPDVLDAIDRAVELTKGNSDAILNVCFPYTSRDEITTAMRNVVEEYTTPVPTTEKERTFSEIHITHHIRAKNLFATSKMIRAHSPASGAVSDAEDSTISSSSTLQPSTPPEHMDLPDHLAKKSISYPDPENITTTTLTSHMFVTGMPPLDLLIRTSGVERLSDFMLWQVHQNTEISFLDCMWPEFDLWMFLPVLIEWQWRRRKEGAFERSGLSAVKRREKSLQHVQ